MTGPLAGVRIVDLSTLMSGPIGTSLLGDQGADVIKIEAPGMGDPLRVSGTMHRGMSACFVGMDRNKRSVVLDLRKPEGVEVLKRVVATADAFVENFRPGVTDRMGVGYEAMRAVRPSLVYLSISGYGPAGPFAKQPVYDTLLQGVTGLASIQAAGGDPRIVRTPVLDKVTAILAAQSLTSALFERERTGDGQHVHLSLLDASLWMMWPDVMMNETFLDQAAEKTPGFKAASFIHETADGHMIALASSDPQWRAMCEVAERPDWAADPRFATLPERSRHMDLWSNAVAGGFRGKTTAEWLALFDKAGVPAATVNDPTTVASDPRVVASGSIVEVDHPQVGPTRQVRSPARFSRTPADEHRPAPAHGEHTDEVLGEAGYGADAIAALRAAGVLG